MDGLVVKLHLSRGLQALYVVLFITMSMCHIATADFDSGVREYCQWEKFNATCPPNEIIIMQSALYGRMHAGTCLTENDHIGCTVDVLNAMDYICSGKNHCIVDIPNPDFQRSLVSCREMVGFLEAQYVCVGGRAKVFQPTRHELSECGPTNPLQVSSTSVGGYISGNTDTQSCHVRVKVQKGQNIQVDLYDFNVAKGSGTLVKYETGSDGGGGGGYDTFGYGSNQNEKTAVCEMYALLMDAASSPLREITVCAENSRYTHVFTTVGNELDIMLIPNANKQANFLLKYKAIGCPDVTPPPEAHVVRQGRKATVKCNFTSNTWHIVCKDTQWVGTISNCSAELGSLVPKTTHGEKAKGKGIYNTNAHSYGLIVAVFIGVLIGVICGFIMLTFVMLARRRRRHRYSRAAMSNKLNNDPNCPNYGLFNQGHCAAHTLGGNRAGPDGNYTHIWRLQRTAPQPPSSQAQTLSPANQRLMREEHLEQQQRLLASNAGSNSQQHQQTPGYNHSNNNIDEQNNLRNNMIEKSNDYDTHPTANTLPAVTYVCKHNKTYEKPIPQIISDNQQRLPVSTPVQSPVINGCPQQTLQTMDIDRHRLWNNSSALTGVGGKMCSSKGDIGVKDPRVLTTTTPVSDNVNDSGIET